MLNWKEDAVIFRRSAHNHPLKPVAKKYARCGRTIRALVLGVWFISEMGYALYDKIVKCRWNAIPSPQEKLDDFDINHCYFRSNTLKDLEQDVDEQTRYCWWCYTKTSYSAHLYGFFAGTRYKVFVA